MAGDASNAIAQIFRSPAPSVTSLMFMSTLTAALAAPLGPVVAATTATAPASLEARCPGKESVLRQTTRKAAVRTAALLSRIAVWTAMQ